MPISDITAYHRPETLADALRLLKEGRGRAVPLAGGTALLGDPPRDVEAVVDLRALQLDWIVPQAEGGLSLGAMATLDALMHDEALRDYAAGTVAEAARLAAGSLVRNRATLGGTLVGRAGHSDLAALLLALDAVAVVTDGTKHEVALTDFFRRRAYWLQPGSLLLEVRLPKLPERSHVRLERVARTPMDQPILAVAAWVQWAGDTMRAVRVAVSGVGGDPVRLRGVEEAIAHGAALDDALPRTTEGLALRDDTLASAAYREAMLPVLVRRALRE